MYFAFFFSEALTDRQLLIAMSVFALVFPIWFFRYARALWIAFDELWDPTSAPPTATVTTATDTTATDTNQHDVTKSQ